MVSRYSSHIPLAERAAAFLSASPDPFHAVHNSIGRLKKAGFEALSGSKPLSGSIRPGGKYYYTVESSTLVAFTVGAGVKKGTPMGFHVIGGHTDSPNLKVKPRSKKTGGGCTLLGVECYGGGLWHTWFDRDLGISGRVFVRSASSEEGEHKKRAAIRQRLVRLDDPIARISTLAIHLQSAEERKGFSVNKENHTAPIIATEGADIKINSPANEQAKAALEKGADEQLNARDESWSAGHEPLLLEAVADKLGLPVTDILDFELNLYDTQPAALGGIGKEFLYSARLDNLATVFCGIEAISQHAEESSAGGEESDEDVSVMVAFDHEEVGSTSAQGAGSPVMQEAIQRISAALQGEGTAAIVSPDFHAACVRRSFILSIDQAHAIHPNYASKHEAAHSPKLNAGVVIKRNSNQRYATNGVTGLVVRELGKKAGVPVQEFVVRNDCPCGSTIGPTISSLTGIRTVDAGMPQLSMHSCREVMGVADLSYGLELFKTFYSGFRALDNELAKDIEP